MKRFKQPLVQLQFYFSLAAVVWGVGMIHVPSGIICGGILGACSAIVFALPERRR